MERLQDGQRGTKRLLEEMLAIAAAAGTQFESLDPDALPGIPPALIVASRRPRPGGEPVKLTIGDREVIAIVTQDGSPIDVWAAIQERASLA